MRDGTKSIAGNAVFITSLRDDWNNIHGTSLDSLKALTERYAGPALWEFASAYVLAAPTWLVLGIIGSICILHRAQEKAADRLRPGLTRSAPAARPRGTLPLRGASRERYAAGPT